jgi:hypothetical protein
MALTVAAELERAFAAARRYEDLRCGRDRPDGFTTADIPRLIFDEFYGHQAKIGRAVRVSGRRCIRVGFGV